MFSGHKLSLSHAAAAPSNADILQLLPPRDIAMDRDWPLWKITVEYGDTVLKLTVESNNVSTLVAQTCQPSWKRFVARKKAFQASTTLIFICSFGCWKTSCISHASAAFKDVQQLKAEVLLSSHACHVLSVQEKCSIRAPCLSSPGFHHLLQQRAYEEGESLLPQSLYFSNSHWKILATTVVLVVKHKSGHTFMWCGWISKVATPNRRSAPAACHLHNCHWYLEIDEYTCAPSTKIKDKKNWGAHRGAKGTFGGKLAVGLKHLHAQSDETSFTTWLTWQ